MDAKNAPQGVVIASEFTALAVIQSLAGGNVPMVTEEEHYEAVARQREGADA